MTYKPDWYDLEELVCPEVYYKFGDMAWQFLCEKQLKNMDWVRIKLGPVFVNNWATEPYIKSDYMRYIAERSKNRLPIIENDLPAIPAGMFTQRGLRCNICSLVTANSAKGIVYVSPHILGKADDYDVQGRTPEEIRQYIIRNSSSLPFPCRLEAGVDWVHMDSEDAGMKVSLFNP